MGCRDCHREAVADEGEAFAGELSLAAKAEQFPGCGLSEPFGSDSGLVGYCRPFTESEGDIDATSSVRAELNAAGIVGTSEALADTLRYVVMAAPLDVTVLLTGASGTGKSQLARVIHENGPRAKHPFVEINCAALPETLIENELFGAVAGGHSTARRAVPGRIAAAEGGTLFLDEVAELPLGAQAKLLQLLDSKIYYPLGSAVSVQTDVRLIAATNANLPERVQASWFREDLFYRLEVLSIRLPALAERRGDILELACFCRTRAAEQHGLRCVDYSAAAVRELQTADWPGNIRQLAHTVESALIRAVGERSSLIEPRHVFPETERRGEDAAPVETYQRATRRFQRNFLCRCLEEHHWNVTETARCLDLARSHVYNLIHVFGLQRRGFGSLASVEPPPSVQVHT